MRKDKKQALALRRIGKSYNEISSFLNVPKSTLSQWLSGHHFSQSIAVRLRDAAKRKWSKNITAYNIARSRAIQKKRALQRSDASATIKRLARRELWLMGIALYWAEGFKRTNHQVDFANSDPAMIHFMMRFFEKCCAIPKGKIYLHIQIHDSSLVEAAERYWTRITGLTKASLRKTTVVQSRASKGKRNPQRLPYGTCRLRIYDSDLVNCLKGWIDGVGSVASY